MLRVSRAPDPVPPETAPGGISTTPWHRWLQTPAGRCLSAWESAQCADAVADIFGFYAVQIGLPEIDCLAMNRMPHRYRMRVDGGQADMVQADGRHDGPARNDGMNAGGPHEAGAMPVTSDLVAAVDELPFASESIDLVVLAHQLEFSADPHRVLRECERVLRPDGRLIVTGFNPHSLWGLCHSLGGGLFAPYLRGPARFIGVPRLRDWMRLLNLEVDEVRHGCYSPAWRSARRPARMDWLERAGDRWWPILGSAYVLTAAKRVHAMRLQGPVWRAATSVPAAVIPAPVVTVPCIAAPTGTDRAGTATCRSGPVSVRREVVDERYGTNNPQRSRTSRPSVHKDIDR